MKHLSTTDTTFPADFASLLDEARETTDNVADVVRAIITDVRSRGEHQRLELVELRIEQIGI